MLKGAQMKTLLAGLAAAALVAAVAPSQPADAMPMQNLAATEAAAGASNLNAVQYRRHYRRYPRRAFVRPDYYPYPSYGYGYRQYAPGPWVGFGPFGFGFGPRW
ncbi:MAG: hypothetical protein QOI12_4845 [Alphaproteobacteria bacterium]|nr:hypothetical protein [Alphaproteobacteria bacterium]